MPKNDSSSSRRYPPPKLNQLWMADRTCVPWIVYWASLSTKPLIIRQHQNLPWAALSELKAVGQLEAGAVWEQTIQIQPGEKTLTLRT